MLALTNDDVFRLGIDRFHLETDLTPYRRAHGSTLANIASSTAV